MSPLRAIFIVSSNRWLSSKHRIRSWGRGIWGRGKGIDWRLRLMITTYIQDHLLKGWRSLKFVYLLLYGESINILVFKVLVGKQECIFQVSMNEKWTRESSLSWWIMLFIAQWNSFNGIACKIKMISCIWYLFSGWWVMSQVMSL